MTPEQLANIEAAEVAVQKAYGGDGDLIEALVELRKVYATEGLISAKVNLVDGSIKVISSIKKTLFMSDEQRAANAAALVVQQAAEAEERKKQELYDDWVRENPPKVSKKK